MKLLEINEEDSVNKEALAHLKHLLRIGYKLDGATVKSFIKKYKLENFLEKIIKND